MKLLTRRRKPIAPLAEDAAYDVAALVPALAQGRWAVPDRFNFTRDVVEVLARDPKRRALTFLGKDGVIEPRSFLRIAEGAAGWATLLRQNGVEPGDRVLVLAGKTPDWLEVMLAVLKVGAVAVPCPEAMSAAALGVRASVAGGKVVVAGESSRGEVERVANFDAALYIEETVALSRTLPDEAPTHDTSSRDPAFVLTTSGTAEGPRGVVHTHGAAFAARVAAEHWLDAGPHDAVWCTADASSATAVWNALIGPWSRGAEIVLHQEEFDPDDRLRCIRRLDTTILCQTPAEYKALLGANDLSRYRPPKLRRLVSTGEHLSADVIAAYEEAWDLTICDGYGQAETGIFVANGAGPGFRAGSIGVPLPGFDVAVVDEQGNELTSGAVGELALRGRPPTLFAGYWDAPEETKAAFRGDAYLTGDTAASDEDGFLWFVGRSADIVLSGGGRFGPVEVEEALNRHRAVADSAVVGMRDLQRGGQFARAFVVLAPGFEASDRLAAEIREHAAQSLAAHKVPREIELVDSLPTTADSKIKRLELRERPATGLAAEWSPAPAPTLATEPVAEPEPEPMALVEPLAGPSDVEVPTAFEAEPVPEPWVEPLEERTAPTLEAAPESPPRAGMLDPEPAAPQERLLEPLPGPAADLDPEPEPESSPDPAAPAPEATFVPEPDVAARPEVPLEPVVALEPEARAEPAPEPQHVPEFEPEPEPEPEPAPEPAAQVVLEPSPAPEAPAPPHPEASELEAPRTEREPAEREPAEREPAEPELAAPEPLSTPEPAHEPDPGPAPEPEWSATVVPFAEPRRAPEPDPEDLPDFIVVPGRERPAENPPAGPPDPSGLGFPPVTELILELDENERPAQRESPSRAAEKERRAGKDRRRSSHEPGDESDETGWMQGLSNRLSAYSLSEDASPPDPPEDEG